MGSPLHVRLKAGPGAAVRAGSIPGVLCCFHKGTGGSQGHGLLQGVKSTWDLLLLQPQDSGSWDSHSLSKLSPLHQGLPSLPLLPLAPVLHWAAVDVSGRLLICTGPGKDDALPILSSQTGASPCS